MYFNLEFHMTRIWYIFAIHLVFLSHAYIQSEESEKKVVYFLTCYWGNDIFNPDSKEIVFYDLETTFRLHKAAAEAGYDLRVADSTWNCLRDLSEKGPEYPENFEYIIAFQVVPFHLEYLSKYPKEKLILILWEPHTTAPDNFIGQYHTHFSKVYTWHDQLVDNKKYFKIYYPVLRPMIKNPINFEDKKFCIMVAGNKFSGQPNEIYTERRKIVEFFENNHPSDLDLFGGDWPTTYKTFKGGIHGGIDKKIENMKSYKFAISYENGKDIPGYVTEKIFHCFQAGIVPVYWGASNITSYVPKNCFISREDFKSNEELYDHLKSMSKDKYMEYIKNIQIFLDSEQAQLYSFDNFVKIMMELITTPPMAKEDVLQQPKPLEKSEDSPS